MKMKLKNQEKGFTIIEVLIVLAIAGLIMLIVFLAVPTLQRNARNTSRNDEASRISSAVNDCLANRNGQNASCLTDAALGLNVATDLREITNIGYVNGNVTTATAPAAPTGVAATNYAVVWQNRSCAADGASVQTAVSLRRYAVVYTLEPNTTRCLGS